MKKKYASIKEVYKNRIHVFVWVYFLYFFFFFFFAIYMFVYHITDALNVNDGSIR